MLNMNFLYNKTTGEVKAISDKKIKFSNTNFASKEIKVSKEDSKKIDNGYKLKIEKGKLVTAKSEDMDRKELKEKAGKGKLTNDEIQQILSNLI